MFNPFDKDINDLEFEDIKKLIKNEVSEGWNIEFKSILQPSSKIAKSIASFANSEGGWYIVGIKDNKNSNIAETISGIDLTENKHPENTINNSIKDQISPIPYFKIKLIHCPKNNKRAVIVVYVPEGYDVPYFTKDGKIYQRIGESSDPQVLKDRYLFEKLIEKKRLFNKGFKQFTQNQFNASSEDLSNYPFLEVFIYLDTNLNLFHDFYSEVFFEKVKKEFNSQTSVLDKRLLFEFKFTNFYSSVDSYIFRYLNETQKSINVGTTIEIFKQGHLKVIAPFYNLKSENGYEYFDNFLCYLDNEEENNLIIVDVVALLLYVSIVLNQHYNLISEYNYKGNVYLKMKFKKCGLTIPYFDSEEYIKFI